VCFVHVNYCPCFLSPPPHNTTVNDDYDIDMQSRVRLVSRVSRLTRLKMFAYMRGLATATKAKEVLPLKGIKVLDMTRVLAGVSSVSLSFSFLLSCPSLAFMVWASMCRSELR
jgi:hypothetical protein